MVSEEPLPTIVLLLLTDRTNFDVLVGQITKNDSLSRLISEQPLTENQIEEYMAAHLQARHAAAAAAAAETTRLSKRKRRSVITSHTANPEDDETYLVYPEDEDVRILVH